MIYIGSDHGGYKLKEDLKRFMLRHKLPFEDLGPSKLDPFDDYPFFAKKVAEAVSKDPGKNRGILMCRSGHGVCIVANKFKGVRAALCWNDQLAVASRKDDDANVLCLPSDYISCEIAEEVLKTWL